MTRSVAIGGDDGTILNFFLMLIHKFTSQSPQSHKTHRHTQFVVADVHGVGADVGDFWWRQYSRWGILLLPSAMTGKHVNLMFFAISTTVSG
jgi:hypothetical protein